MTVEKISAANHIGLQKLLVEPTRLLVEAQKVNDELESLIIHNYKVFVENLTCSIHLQSQDQNLLEISNKLSQHVLNLSQTCSSFKEIVQPFLSCHKRNRKTLQHHLQLLELLELPQLVDACTRNGFWDEAIDLANFVNGLERRHLLATEVKSNDSKGYVAENVMEGIVNDVHLHLLDLRHQLLLQLTENNPLPKLMQIVATLRKMDGLFVDRRLNLKRFDKSGCQLTEDEREKLRQSYIHGAAIKQQMDFLEARTVWMERLQNESRFNSLHLESCIETSISLGAYGRAIEMLEIRRTALFSIISQFYSLFEENEATSVLNSEISGNSSFSMQITLQSWINQHVSMLIKDLRSLLLLVDDAASIRSIFEQCLFLSARLGSVGCDFTTAALSLLEEFFHHKIQQELDTALKNFTNILSSERIVNSDGQEKREQIIPLYTLHEWDIGSSNENEGNSDKEIPYPQLLLKFPPLSFLLNAILSMLNFLRECPLSTLYEMSLDLIFELFTSVQQNIMHNFADIRQRGAKYFGDGFMTNLGNRAESKLYSIGNSQLSVQKSAINNSPGDKYDVLLATAFIYDLVPHVLLCHESIFGKIQYSTVMAVHSKLPLSSKLEAKHLSSILNEGFFTPYIVSKVEQLQRPLVEAKLIEKEVLNA